MEERLEEDIIEYFGEAYVKKHQRALARCITRAINAYKSRRNYPSHFSDKQKESDMDLHYECIFDLTMYWFVKMGVEFQSSHIENTVHRNYTSENSIYVAHGVHPYVSVFGC